jgi:hypothetical protein
VTPHPRTKRDDLLLTFRKTLRTHQIFQLAVAERLITTTPLKANHHAIDYNVFTHVGYVLYPMLVTARDRCERSPGFLFLPPFSAVLLAPFCGSFPVTARPCSSTKLSNRIMSTISQAFGSLSFRSWNNDRCARLDD